MLDGALMQDPSESNEGASDTVEVTVSLAPTGIRATEAQDRPAPAVEQTNVSARSEAIERGAGRGRTGDLGPAVSLADSELGLIHGLIGGNRYTILGEIGAGGMATVYAARDEVLLRNVALKLQRGEADPAGSRFLEEAQVLGQLEHPNIVPLYTLETASNGAVFSTMRYLRGSSLHDVLRGLIAREPSTVGEYSLTRLMQIFLQITQGVSYAHNQGVIHRDLKPANVMLGEHGEVQVVDWGIAKVRAEGGVQTDSQRGLTLPGQIVGTPAYMAPEQWVGAVVDERADIYSLGVMLYELLTLRRPFDAGSPLVLCRDVLSVPPALLRTVSPERNVPIELEQACLKALAKVPEERQQTVRELYRAVQTWLETETDKERRHALAEQRVAEARALLQTYHVERGRLAELERDTHAAAAAFKTWQSVSEKSAIYEAEDKARVSRRRLIDISTEVVGVLIEALGFERENSAARELLADYYWDRLLEAEQAAEPDRSEFYVRLVQRYHDGKYARQISGEGSLALLTEPAGASVRLYPLEEKELCMQPSSGSDLGHSPIREMPLPRGSYLLRVKHPGYAPVSYPVYISRNQRWDERVRLYREAEIAPGFCYIPGGPFIEGGDAEGWSLPRSEPRTEDFAIARHPVTVLEYFEFLHALADADLAAAKRRAPRRTPDGGSYATHHPERGFEVPPDLPDGMGEPNAPVSGISWHDARAYCEWRSGRDGRAYRLPSAREWEKAARGVDGRWFPWGNRFDASLCNIRESTSDAPRAAPVDSFPSDESVYGVRGMAGNMRDWTETASVPDSESSAPLRVVRGGAWYGGRVSARCADRFWFEPSHVYFFVGFRLAYSLPPIATPIREF